MYNLGLQCLARLMKTVNDLLLRAVNIKKLILNTIENDLFLLYLQTITDNLFLTNLQLPNFNKNM